MSDFPYYSKWLDKDEAWKFIMTTDVKSEKGKIRYKNNYNGVKIYPPENHIVYLYQQKEMMKMEINGKSPMDFWKEHKKEIKKNNPNPIDQYEALWKIPMYRQVTSFKPLAAKYMYDNYGGKAVLDISAGHGDRLIGALLSGVDYYAFDPNTKLKKGHNAIIKDARTRQMKSKVSIVYEPFETANLDSIPDVDLVFTSPPFFTYEIYSKDPTQSSSKYPVYNDWFDKFLMVSIKKSFAKLKTGGYIAIHLSDTSSAKNVVKDFLKAMTNINCKFHHVVGIKGDYSNQFRPIWVFKKN